jgi:hypothetical protein
VVKIKFVAPDGTPAMRSLLPRMVDGVDDGIALNGGHPRYQCLAGQRASLGSSSAFNCAHEDRTFVEELPIPLTQFFADAT